MVIAFSKTQTGPFFFTSKPNKYDFDICYEIP